MAGESSLSFLGNIGGYYAGYKAYKDLFTGNFLSALSGGLLGGGKSRSSQRRRYARYAETAKKEAERKLHQQYTGLVGSFDKGYLTPQIKSMHGQKRDIVRGNIRFGGETYRNILSDLEGVGGKLKTNLDRRDYGGIKTEIGRVQDLIQGLSKETEDMGPGSRGGGRPLNLPNLNIVRSPKGHDPALSLPDSRLGTGSYIPFRSESNRPIIGTNITPSSRPSSFKPRKKGAFSTSGLSETLNISV